jgi:MFS family permease
VGIGTIGSLFMRLAMGTGMDRRGPRLVWLGSIVLFAAACFAHLMIGSPTGPAVYLLRIAYSCATAGIFSASITFVAMRAPAGRMAEAVGMLGTSGFLANIAGTQLGDMLRGSGELHRWQLDAMFVAAGLIGLGALPLAWLALRGYAHRNPGPQVSVFHSLRRYHPGAVLMVVVVMGVALNLPNTFLPTYAAELRIERIALFFTVYSLAAVVTRVLTRRWPQKYGLRAMMLLGVAGMGVSQLFFLLVRNQWDLWLPGLAYGLSHAVLFPATVALGNRWFPEQHRGLGTTLVLAAWDMGLLLGMPTAGVLLHYSESAGLPPYPTLFLSVAGLVAVAGVWYMIGGREEPRPTADVPLPRGKRVPRRKGRRERVRL